MTFRKIVPIVFLVALAAIAAYLLIKQHVTSEEARVRKLIKKVERGFEGQKLKPCMAIVADDYSDNIMHDSREELKRSLQMLFLRAHDIDVSISNVSIRIRGDEADVSMTMTATADGASLTQLIGHTHFILAARKENGRWKVYRAEGVD